MYKIQQLRIAKITAIWAWRLLPKLTALVNQELKAIPPLLLFTLGYLAGILATLLAS